MEDKEKKNPKKSDSQTKNDKAKQKGYPGYPHYPASEDIFNNEKEVDLKMENLAKEKNSDELFGIREESDFDGNGKSTKDRTESSSDEDIKNQKNK